MNKYKVKHIRDNCYYAIKKYEHWIATRDHITLVNVNMIEEDTLLNIIITYMEESYE